MSLLLFVVLTTDHFFFATAPGVTRRDVNAFPCSICLTSRTNSIFRFISECSDRQSVVATIPTSGISPRRRHCVGNFLIYAISVVSREKEIVRDGRLDWKIKDFSQVPRSDEGWHNSNIPRQQRYIKDSPRFDDTIGRTLFLQ